MTRASYPAWRRRVTRTALGAALAVTSAGAAACAATAPPATAPTTATPAPASARRDTTFAPADAAFLDTLQRRTFDFFWETTNPRNGLVPDRWPTRTFSSIAAVGFGLTAYPIGVERGWVTRDQAAERVLTTLRFFWRAPQGPAASGMAGHRGFFYHFLDLDRGTRFQQVELSTIDTTLLLGGALFCQAYFDGSSAVEREIRALADSLYRRVDWNFVQARAPRVTMGWYPESGLHAYDWRGYDEAMLLYVLALASPTHPIDPSAWAAYTEDYEWGPFYGYEMVSFAPLFGHQYSHVWIDFRGIQDAYMRGRGIDYFENARRATLSQKAYAHYNPLRWRDYGGDIWGLSASDGPGDTTLVVGQERRIFSGYMARGAAANEIRDDGTITPTAAGGSLPFAPEASIPALRAMRSAYGGVLFDRYGFLDSFNPTLRDNAPWPKDGRVVPGQTWVDVDYLGIDQGAILIMAENLRSGLVWRLMREHPVIRRGLERAGFTGGWLAAPRAASPGPVR
ncbi:MAG: glucoamylase family protein [Gemmatimonadaceae bacterium]